MSTEHGGTGNRGRKRVFYGWYIIAALFFVTFISIGARQGFGIFISTWEEDWGVTTAAISFVGFVGTLASGFSQPIFGWLADRYGGRPIVIVSLAVMALGTIAVAAVSSVIGLVVLYGLVISFASGGISPATTGVIVVRWFKKRRGMAMSVLVAGGSVGGLIFVPFLDYVELEFDWRIAWIVTGSLALVIGIPLILLIVRSKPEDMGLKIDGVKSIVDQDSDASQDPVGPKYVERWTLALRSRPIWQLSFGYFVCGITTSSIAFHYVRWAQSEDISRDTAALAFGLLSGINACGVIVIGLLSDRLQRKNLLGVVYLVRGVAFLALIFLPGSMALWSFALIGGMSWLATVPLTASLTADVYGVRNLGTLFGLANMSHAFGGAAAVWAFGLAFTHWGSYDVPFAVGAVTLLAAGIVSFSIKEKKDSVRYVQVPREVILSSDETTGATI